MISYDIQEFNFDSLFNVNVLFADLMLAQAQEMVVLKAIRDKMKDQIVAKLCVSCEELVSHFFYINLTIFENRVEVLSGRQNK